MDMYFPWRSIRTSAFEMHRFDILDRFFLAFSPKPLWCTQLEENFNRCSNPPKNMAINFSFKYIFFSSRTCAVHDYGMIMNCCFLPKKNELISKESFHGNLFDWRYESILYVIFEKAWILKQSQWFHHFGSFSDHSDNPNDCFIRSWKVECVRG